MIFFLLLKILIVSANAEVPLPGPVTEPIPALEGPAPESPAADTPPIEIPIKVAPDFEERLTPRHAITTGIEVPQPLSIGYEITYPSLPMLHFFAEGGYFYMPLNGSLKKAVIWSVQGGARYFPFQSWWYLTGSLGFRQIELAANISNLQVNGVALANDADLFLNAMIVNTAVGGQWFLSKNVAISVELGVQLPVPGLHGGVTSIVQTSTQNGLDLSTDSSNALEAITNNPIPQIALVRFIWYID